MENLSDRQLKEPSIDQQVADRKRELDIKEREVATKEREATAKEREVLLKGEELKRSRWLNPTVIGLFAAALGLIGSVVVARVNNSNTQEVQRLQSEANVTLEAIKTGTGNTDAACKNLIFFVDLGLIRDPEGKIKTQCKGTPSGPPSLPVNETSPKFSVSSIQGQVVDDNLKPVAEAKVVLLGQGGGGVTTDRNGNFQIPLPHEMQVGDIANILVSSKTGEERITFPITGQSIRIFFRPSPR